MPTIQHENVIYNLDHFDMIKKGTQKEDNKPLTGTITMHSAYDTDSSHVHLMFPSFEERDYFWACVKEILNTVMPKKRL